MINNCYLEMLDIDLQNSNLGKLGECRIAFKSASAENYLYLLHKDVATSNVKYEFSVPVTVKNGAQTETLATNATSYTANQGIMIIAPANTECVVSVPDKYRLREVQISSGVEAKFTDFSYMQNFRLFDAVAANSIENVDISAFKDITSLEIFNIKNGGSGDVSNLASTNLIEMKIYGTNSIHGDIESLSASKNIRTLIINTTDITGSVDNFLDTIAAARTISNPLLLRISNKVTFSEGGEGSYTINFSNGSWSVAS